MKKYKHTHNNDVTNKVTVVKKLYEIDTKSTIVKQQKEKSRSVCPSILLEKVTVVSLVNYCFYTALFV